MISKADTDCKLYTMTTIVISYMSERFGYVQKEHKKKPRNNCQEKKIHQLKHELRSLKRQYKKSKWGGKITPFGTLRPTEE